MQYFRDAPAPSGMTRKDFTSGVLASEKVGDKPREQRERYFEHINATNDAFRKSSDRTYTYLRLGKWVFLIIDPVPEEGTDSSPLPLGEGN